MHDIDPDTLDAKVETERQQLVSTLRRIADRLEAMSREDVIEPLAIVAQATPIPRSDVVPAALRGTRLPIDYVALAFHAVGVPPSSNLPLDSNPGTEQQRHIPRLAVFRALDFIHLLLSRGLSLGHRQGRYPHRAAADETGEKYRDPAPQNDGSTALAHSWPDEGCVHQRSPSLASMLPTNSFSRTPNELHSSAKTLVYPRGRSSPGATTRHRERTAKFVAAGPSADMTRTN